MTTSDNYLDKIPSIDLDLDTKYTCKMRILRGGVEMGFVICTIDHISFDLINGANDVGVSVFCPSSSVTKQHVVTLPAKQ